ncbi:MAG: hypothetical protein ACLU9S_04900 [Oscillospiraceae bacterium]
MEAYAVRRRQHGAAGAAEPPWRAFGVLPLPANQNDVCWVNNWHPAMDCTRIADQTKTEMDTRATMRQVLAYLKGGGALMAFRDAFLYDIAPRLGTLFPPPEGGNTS